MKLYNLTCQLSNVLDELKERIVTIKIQICDLESNSKHKAKKKKKGYGKYEKSNVKISRNSRRSKRNR